MKDSVKKQIRRLLNIQPIKLVYDSYCSLLDYLLLKKRMPYFSRLQTLVHSNTSIITNNCFAGRVMQDFEMKYNSPTLGLYFWYPDYIEFLSNLKYYLTEAKLTFVEHSKYKIGDERRAKWKHWYPIGLLDGKVEIAFLHYHTEEDAAEKWYRRCSRVNFEDLIIIGSEQNNCTIQDIINFSKLSFKNKIFFSTKNLPDVQCNCMISEFESMGEVGDPYKKAHIYYKYLSQSIHNGSLS